MTREEQRAKAAHEYIQSDSVAAGNEVLAFGDFINGAKWADSHPNWISVEDEPYPPKKNKWDKKSEEVLIYGLWMGRPTRLFGTYHYDTNEWGANGLISNITHWMPIVPPRKEE